MLDLSPRPLRLSEADRRLWVDRQRELEVVLSSLRHGSNVLLLGDRGSGKTSFVHHAAGVLEEEGGNVAVVPGSVAESAGELLELVVDAVSSWPVVEPPRRNEAEGSPMQMSLGRDIASARVLLADVDLLRRELRARSSGIVFVDELSGPAIPRTIFGRLRDELWEMPVAWCAAAEAADRGAYVAPPADAFWSRVVELAPLGAGAARELLRRRAGDAITDEQATAIIDAASGNPRRLLQLAQEVAAGVGLERVVASAQSDIARRRELSAPARRLLEELEARGPAGPSDKTLLTKLGWTRGRASQVFKELAEFDLVRESLVQGDAGRPRKVYEVRR